MDEGWTRWLLEQYGFQFTTLRPEDFRGQLRDKADVVILADDARIPAAGAGRGVPAGRGGNRPRRQAAAVPADAPPSGRNSPTP